MKVGLFIPCYIDAFFPAVGIATLELLERLGCTVEYPLEQTCCGQPMANSGCQEDAAATEAQFVRCFQDFDTVVGPSGSCVHHVRFHLDAVDQTPQARKVRTGTQELVEFLHDDLKVEAFPWAAFPHKSLIKSKSMLQEECGMTPYLQKRGIEVTESDLGERIQQLSNEPPSHIVVPAIHKLRTDVAALFAQDLGTDPKDSDPHYLAEAMRENARPRFMKADAGMTGANFAVAETGGFVVCTNEGNADIGASVPPLHVASIGIEKLIPRARDLGVFIRMLSRSALGSPITQYTSHFHGPRRGGELHVVLVDNTRSDRLGSPDFWHALKCIRCGACMNTCPVYRRGGGLSYGATYSGPIGVILDPGFDLSKYRELPFHSSLCGSWSY